MKERRLIKEIMGLMDEISHKEKACTRQQLTKREGECAISLESCIWEV